MTKKKNKNTGKKNGRPTKYSKNFLPLATALGELGLIDSEVALRMGIRESTLNNWKKKYPEFKKALNNGKAIVDREVENELLKATKERVVEDSELIVRTDKNGKPIKGDSKIKKIKKTVFASVPACIFWLKNRQPDKWRDASHVTVANDDVKKAGEEMEATFSKAK